MDGSSVWRTTPTSNLAHGCQSRGRPSHQVIGNGLPLVTTPEGARGLEALAESAILVADDAGSFASRIRDLVADEGMRLSLADAAYRYAAENLSPEACYDSLVDAISNW